MTIIPDDKMQEFEQSLSEADRQLLEAAFDEKTYYAFFGDVHGKPNALLKALSDAEEWRQRNNIPKSKWQKVLLGDLIDRGTDSGRVLEIVRNEIEDGTVAVLGNHDDLLIKTAESGKVVFGPRSVHSGSSLWAANEGEDTCKQIYGEAYYTSPLLMEHDDSYTHLSKRRELIRKSWQYDLLKSLPLVHTTKNIFICHAPQSVKPDGEISENMLLWGNQKDIGNGKGPEQYIVPGNYRAAVHGHVCHPQIFFPQYRYFMHGSVMRLVVLCDNGCSNAYDRLHPVIISEAEYRNEVRLEAIL